MNTGTWQAITSLGGAARTELTHRVEIAHRLQVERRRLQARALEGCIHSRFEVLRQRFHGSWGRDPACEDPLMHCGAWPSATGCRLGGCFQRVEGRPTDRGEGLHRGALTSMPAGRPVRAAATRS